MGLFNAAFTAQSAVGNGHCVIQCTSRRPSSHLPKHIPAMPKQALLLLVLPPPPPLTAAHFSCALKFNSVPCRAPPLSPPTLPPIAPRPSSPPALLPPTPQQRLFVDKRDFIFLVIPPPVSTCGGGCIIPRATGLCERARTLHQCHELSYFIFVFVFVSSGAYALCVQVYDLP